MKKITDENIRFIFERVSFFDFFEVRLHLWGLTWTIPVSGILFVVGSFLVMNFLVALTPAEAIAQGYPSMPSDWEAGVWSHGSFYRWYLPENHPVLFILSSIMGAGPVFYMFAMLLMVFREWWKIEEKLDNSD